MRLFVVEQQLVLTTSNALDDFASIDGFVKLGVAALEAMDPSRNARAAAIE